MHAHVVRESFPAYLGSAAPALWASTTVAPDAGAVAASLLGQAGLKVYVCDKSTSVYEKPRAIALDHEIMRVFQ